MANKTRGFGFNITLNHNDFDKGIDSIRKSLDKVFGANLMTLSNTAAVSFAALGSAITGVTVAAYKFGQQMDKMNVALQATWGNVATATAQYRKFQNIVENTDYNMNQLASLDKTMKALGYDSENSANAIKRFVNAGIANPNANIQGLADKLLAIKTSGKVSAEALRDFADIGIEVSDLAGTTATNAIDTLMDRMQQFNGIMENESQDAWQQLQRCMDIFKDAAGELGLFLNDKLKVYFVAIGDVLAKLRDKFVSLLKHDGKGIYDFIDAIAALGVALLTVAIPRITSLSLAMAPLAIKIGLVTAAVLGLAEIFKAAFRKDGALGTALVEFFKWIYYEVVKVLARIGETISNWLMQLAHEAGFDKIAQAISSVGTSIARTFTDAKKKADSSYKELAKAAEKIKNESILSGLVNTAKEVASAFGGDDKHEIVIKGLDGNNGKLSRNTSTDAINPDRSNAANSGTKSYKLGTGSGGMMGYALGVGYEFATEAANAPWVQELINWKKNLLEYEKSVEELKQKWQDTKMSLVESFSNGLNEALWASGNFFENMGNYLKDFGKQLIQQVTQMLLFTTILRALGFHYDVQGLNVGNIMRMSDYQKIAAPPSIDDGIVQNGKVIGTDPSDTIIAMKHPENLNGGANVVVNVNNNTPSQVSTSSYFDGTKEIIDIFIDGLNHNVSGIKDMVRSL